ncbi:MAG TPA: nucleotide exchange factor GrpE [Roseiflexaceae bacterium]|nr:nucleotide exchange factor GrpE [Roseiflexaceae bacterium]
MTEERENIPVNGTEEQTAEPAEPTVDESQERIAQLEKENEELRNNWLRAVADYKNFKRRADQERVDLIRGASAGLLLKLLPVVDDFDRAAAGAPQDIASSQWFDGFKLIAQKLQTVLESEGVTPIEALGQEFDPNQHEAVIYEDGGDGGDVRVVGELQKGYKLRDRVLRPTMVKVGKA